MVEEIGYYNVLILYNDDFYKEVDLDSFNTDEVLIGTTEDCNIKLNNKLSDSISIRFKRNGDIWEVMGGKNAYCVLNGIKIPRRLIANGDKFIVKNSETQKELFKINYFLDFIVENENYDRIVSLKKAKNIKIGNDKSNNIFINDCMIEKNHAAISKENDTFYLLDLKSKFGIYLNGKRIDGKIKLKDNDFIIICGYKFLYKNYTLAMSKFNEKIIINKLEEVENPSVNSLLDYPCFYRSPRLLKNLPEDEIVIDDPPQKNKSENNNLILTMIPIMGTIFLAVMMNGSQSNSNIGYSIAMVAMGGIVAILAFAMQTVNYKKQQFKRYKNYKQYVKEREKLIVEKRKIFIESIIEMNPDTEKCISIVEEFNRKMWERSPEHNDFLNMSMGIGKGNLSFNIKVPDIKVEIDKDKLKDDPRKLKDVYGKVDNIPICLNLLKEFPVGVYGNRPFSLEFIKNLLIKISTLHYYEEVKIAIIYPKTEETEWSWAKWLPHVWDDNKEMRYMANTKDAAHNVLNDLYNRIKFRKNNENSDVNKAFLPHYIVIIADNVLIENEPIMSILESDEDYGITGIFVYDHIGLIPQKCKKLIEVIDNNNVNIQDIDKGNEIEKITFDLVDNERCTSFARRMAPVFVKSSYTQNSLTSYLTLFDLYGVDSEDDLHIITNWNNNQIYKTMAVPIGLKAGDEVVYLNLHEKFHGPHGLVAGTTGSGKSEILQTYIASLAINYHPYDVGIIIIDYKGGGMANQFKELPHLIGTITNLDGNQINRALISIKSELKRRQQRFAENDVNHIDAYIKLFKNGVAKEPIPHLIIIADEFAELKNDQPDFMRELVSAARIGRSLGVHLILATQKPSGVVDDQIWSNSKFKLCLKVQNTEDSNEMIKTPLAANIVEAGRAYFQVGNNEIFELFQSAWSGAKKYENDDVTKKELEISEVLVDGNRKLVYSSKDESHSKDGKTQLDAIIQKISKVAAENHVTKLQGPWLPPLEDIIYLNDIIGEFNSDNWRRDKKYINPCIGRIDNPEKQFQKNLNIDFSENGHLLIIGSPGVGKTTLLQTLIMSIMGNYTPDYVNMYILDFGTRILKMFEGALQVGGVITADDEELMQNIIKHIYKEIARRKKLLSDRGVSNVISYREATGELLPQIILIIDNFTAFLELYEDCEDDIMKFSREGANLGISLVVTATNSSAVRYKISSNFKNNIVLNCVDKSEYSNVLGRVSIEPSNALGRGLIKEEQICEFQTALPINGESEAERTKNIKAFINTMNSYWNGKAAKAIPRIPEVLTIDEFVKNNSFEDEVDKIILGLTVSEFEYAKISLESTNFIPIIGDSCSGKSNMLKAVAFMMNETTEKEKYEIYAIDSSTYGLEGVDTLDITKSYCTNFDEIKALMLEIKQEIDSRKLLIKDTITESKGKIKENDVMNQLVKKVILIDNIDEFINSITDEYEITEMLSEIINKNNGYGVVVFAAGEEVDYNNLSYNQPFMDIVKNKNRGILLDGIDNQNYFNVSVKYGTNERTVKAGDGYLISNNGYERIKIPYILH